MEVYVRNLWADPTSPTGEWKCRSHATKPHHHGEEGIEPVVIDDTEDPTRTFLLGAVVADLKDNCFIQSAPK